MAGCEVIDPGEMLVSGFVCARINLTYKIKLKRISFFKIIHTD